VSLILADKHRERLYFSSLNHFAMKRYVESFNYNVTFHPQSETAVNELKEKQGHDCI
jgi:hypothetical protein